MILGNGTRMDEPTFQILLSLKEAAKSFNDLKSLDMSPNTILSHLRETQTKGWVNAKLAKREDKKPRILYNLTSEGETLLKTYGLVISQYADLRREHEEMQKKVKENEKKIKYLLSSTKAD